MTSSHVFCPWRSPAAVSAHASSSGLSGKPDLLQARLPWRRTWRAAVARWPVDLVASERLSYSQHDWLRTAPVAVRSIHINPPQRLAGLWEGVRRSPKAHRSCHHFMPSVWQLRTRVGLFRHQEKFSRNASIASWNTGSRAAERRGPELTVVMTHLVPKYTLPLLTSACWCCRSQSHIHLLLVDADISAGNADRIERYPDQGAPCHGVPITTP